MQSRKRLCVLLLSYKTGTGSSKQLTFITGGHEWDFSNKQNKQIYIYLGLANLTEI